MPHSPFRLTATAALDRIAAGDLTAREWTESCLDRIEALDQQVRAFVHVDPAGARKAAAEVDAGRRKGALAGAPIAAKDIIDTHDMPTAYGSEIYAGARPSFDASPVAMARAAGAVLLGKTVTTEFANLTPGPTRNPLAIDRTPGGSSSGSAAAVAAGMVPMAYGTQTTQSTIRPASYCGVHGYCPTQGDFRLSGVREAAGSFDRLGLIARSIADIALFRDVLIRRRPRPFEAWPEPPSIGFCRTPLWQKMDSSLQKELLRAVARLGDAGATVVEIELPGAEGAWAHSERWMSVAGPTGRWLLRRVGDRFDVVAEVPSSIGAVEVSPDGRRIAFVDHRAETVTVRGPRRSGGTVEIGPASSLSLAWSGDGEVLAVHTVQAFEADGVTWLSTEGGQLVQTRRQHGRIEALAPTTDDVGAVVVGDGGRVRVVTSTDRPLVRLPALHTWSAGPMSTQLFASPDGSSWQLSGFGAPFVAEGASRRVEVPPHPVRANQFHDVHWTLDLGPDHAITTAPSGAVGRWTLDALSFDTYVSSEGGSPDYVDPSLDDAGRLLLLQDTLVDARSGHVVRRFDRPAGDVVGAALSPDGRHVALQVRVPQQADVDVLLFVAETGERRWTRRLEGGFRPRTIAITDDSVVVSARQLVSLARSTGEVQATRSLPTHRLAGRDDLVLVSSWSPFSAHVHALDPVTLSTKWRAEDAWQVALREDGAVYVGTGEDETRVRRLDPTSGKTLETWPVDAYRSLDARHGRVGVTTRRGQLHVWEDA